MLVEIGTQFLQRRVIVHIWLQRIGIKGPLLSFILGLVYSKQYISDVTIIIMDHYSETIQFAVRSSRALT